jgi:hypothetical protein
VWLARVITVVGMIVSGYLVMMKIADIEVRDGLIIFGAVVLIGAMR